MRISTFFYTLQQGMKNIWRNKIFSLASIATMVACIFMFGLFFSIVENFRHVVTMAESNVSITVFFQDGISQEQIDAIGGEIDGRPEVEQKRFVSAQEAWTEFQEVYFSGADGAEDLLSGFNEDNPLENSAHYEVFMTDVSQQPALVTYLESVEGVREVRRSDMAVSTLVDFNLLVGYISVGVILILLAVAIFLISNTVIVGIAVRKEEIAIMKLIGATDFFVRAPFIVEGVSIGLIGSALPLILLYFMYGRIVYYIGDRFVWLSSLLEFLPVNQVFATLAPISLILGIGIGFLGSRLTLHKHLRV